MLRSEAKNSCPTCKNKSTGVFERYTPGLLSQSKSKLEIGLATFLILFCSKHRPRLPGSGSHALHLPDRVRLARRMLPSELGLPLLRQRGPDDSWCGCIGQLGLIILLLALMWFVRLYLHYYSQWLYLQAIAVPVNKWVYSLWYHHECAEIHTRTHVEHFTAWLMGKVQMQTCLFMHAQTHPCVWNRRKKLSLQCSHEMFANIPLMCPFRLFRNSPLNF